MSFLAIRQENLTDDRTAFQNDRQKLFFSPLPRLDPCYYPQAWLDLHISGKGYETCGEDKPHPFEQRNGALVVSIRPGRSLRLRTAESIGIQRDMTGVVTNSAGMAVRGLFVAPGKVDPGYGPGILTLVVTNCSGRSIDLKAGDKIAAIAFAQMEVECAQTDSKGWGDRRIEGYSPPPFRERLRALVRSKGFRDFLTQLIIGAILLLFGYILGKGNRASP